jgi:acyl-CoA synthetase (AMP-forming)/AMP-acid ligase II
VTSVRQLLRQQSMMDRPVLFEGGTDQHASWSDVLRLADAWADAGLQGPVGLAIADPVAMASNFVAALAAGVTVAPMDPSAPAVEAEARAEQFGLTALVSHSLTEDVSRHFGGSAKDEIRTDGARPALIMSSSGTTGKPKVVPLSEQQLMTTARGVASHLRLSPAETGYSPLPLFHINCLVVGVLSSLVAGSALVLERRFSSHAFWPVVQDRDVSWLNLVPAMIAILAEDGGPAPERVRLARSASAPLLEAVRIRFEDRHAIPVIETYGMTEAASQITANPLDAPRPGSVGLPVGVDLRVVDANSKAVPANGTGQVQIRGTAVTDGYLARDTEGGWKRLTATTESGWLATGDLGRLDDDGYLYLTGREDDVINRGGEKVQPREVEDVLLADSRVRGAVVVGRPHPTMGQEPIAFVLTGVALSAREAEDLSMRLAQRCSRSLSRYKQPAEIRVTQFLPAGPTGKIRRAEVRQMAAAASPHPTAA